MALTAYVALVLVLAALDRALGIVVVVAGPIILAVPSLGRY